MIKPELIGIKAIDKNNNEFGLITWAHIFDSTKEYLNVIQKNIYQFPLKNITSIIVCNSLQELSSFPFLYETLWNLSDQTITKISYAQWKERMKKNILQGHDIYFLGVAGKKEEVETRIKTWSHKEFSLLKK